MAVHTIRVHGDPVLRQATTPVVDIDGALVRLVDDMVETMYEAPGVGLAANQVGVQKRLFVWDIGDGLGVAINPTLTGHDGTWTYDEGCLSVPGLYWPIVRSGVVVMTATDLQGREFVVEGAELLARVFLHEVDHLDGHLLLERLDDEQRRDAMSTLRTRDLGLPTR
ncbi:MAG: peptide deformylase [Acidimicrobiales bacterium]